MNYLFTRICFAYFIGDGIDREEFAPDQLPRPRPAPAPRPSAATSRSS